MKKIFLFLVIFALSFGAKAQTWTPIFGKQRFASGLGVPVKDSTYFAGTADSALVYINPKDAGLYYKYKGNHKKVNTGTNYVPYTGATANVNLGSYNLTANNVFDGFSSITASGTQVVLTVNSVPSYLVTGSGGQTIKLPDATTLPKGALYVFNNNQSSGAILVNNNSNTLVKSVPSGAYLSLELIDNANAAGSWDSHFQAPSNVSWSTNTLDYAGSITSATWNGNTVQPNRGGTGQSTYTDGQLLIGNSTGNTLNKATLTAGTGISVTNGAGSISVASTITQYTDANARAALSFAAGSGAYNSTTGVITIPTNTNQLTNGASFITLASLSATSPLSYNNTNGAFSISQATNATNGYLSSTDWTTFNNKQAALSGTGLVKSTAGSITYITDNSSAWNSGSTIANLLNGVSPIGFNSITGAISISQATNSTNGYLSSTDWNTFNGKQNAITLTTTGSSGSATFFSNTINVPTYTLAGLGGQPQLNGTGFVKASGTTISYDNSTYALDADVVKLAGSQTVTGVKTFSGAGNTFTQNTNFQDRIFLKSPSTSTYTNVGGDVDKLLIGVVGATHSFAFSENVNYTYTFPAASGTVALTSNLGSYVPYTGATGAVNLGAYDLTVNGIKVGKGGGNIADNTAVGSLALNANTTGTSNTAFGNLSLYSNTTGGSNSSFGVFALLYNTTGTSNAAFGGAALQANTTGNSNTAVGINALQNNTTGGANTATGVQTLKANTTGIYNTANGANALGSNTTANYNTAIGNNSFLNNTTGENNTGIGNNSGVNITTGSNNTIVGAYGGTTAMSSNVILSDGAGNIRFQWDGSNIKLNGNTVGSNAYNSTAYLPLIGGTLTGALNFNSSFGTSTPAISIYNNTGSSASNVAAIDFRVNNTFGGNERVASISASNPNAGGNNGGQLNFLISPNGTATTPVTAMYLASTGAATFLSNALSLQGASYPAITAKATATFPIFSLINDAQGAQWNIELGRTIGGNLEFYNSGTKISFSSIGSANFGGSVTSANTGFGNTGGLIINYGATAGSRSWRLANDLAAFGDFAIQQSTTQTGNTYSNKMYFDSNGNIGIGTTTPQTNIELANSGMTFASTTTYSASTTKGITLSSTGATDLGNGLWFGLGGLYSGIGGVRTNSSTWGTDLRFFTHPDAISNQYDMTERMRITSGGNVLVGTSSNTSASISTIGSLQVNKEIMSVGSLAGLFWENRSGGVTSNSNWYGWYTTSGTIYLYNGASNIASINSSTGAYVPLSDKNKKKDFEISNIGLKEVLQLKPTLYRMKTDNPNAEKQLGFIAQEVKGIIPAAYQESEGFIGLNFNPIVAALTKAIQELKEELDTTKNELNQKITNLEAQIKQ